MKKSELAYFKKILEERKNQIIKNINGVHDELAQLGACELNDEGDHVATITSSRVDDIIIKKQEQELREINTALRKLESGEYGTCEMCGVDIGFPRLAIKPHAVYCIDCREIAEQEKA